MNTKPAWHEEYTIMLNDCEERSNRLTDWECGFVDSLQRQLVEGRRPTEKQKTRLDEIWEKATAKG